MGQTDPHALERATKREASPSDIEKVTGTGHFAPTRLSRLATTHTFAVGRRHHCPLSLCADSLNRRPSTWSAWKALVTAAVRLRTLAPFVDS
jgi:hypothetical protein